jgi:hypothetical protein
VKKGALIPTTQAIEEATLVGGVRRSGTAGNKTFIAPSSLLKQSWLNWRTVGLGRTCRTRHMAGTFSALF